MKRLLCFLLVLMFILCGCESKNTRRSGSSGSKREETVSIDYNETLFDAILIASQSFNDPSSVRLLNVGDFRLYDWDSDDDINDFAYGAIVRLIDNNNSGGYYLIRLFSCEGKTAAYDVAAYDFDSSIDFWQENWNSSSKNKYPKDTYDTFEEYRQHMIEFNIENYIYNDYNSAMQAAIKEFEDNIDLWQNDWDTTPYNEYPRDTYYTFEEYRQHLIEFYFSDYYIVNNKDIDTGYIRDIKFGVTKEVYSIYENAEDTFSVEKINKSLEDYWNERLGLNQ